MFYTNSVRILDIFALFNFKTLLQMFLGMVSRGSWEAWVDVSCDDFDDANDVNEKEMSEEMRRR